MKKLKKNIPFYFVFIGLFFVLWTSCIHARVYHDYDYDDYLMERGYDEIEEEQREAKRQKNSTTVLVTITVAGLIILLLFIKSKDSEEKKRIAKEQKEKELEKERLARVLKELQKRYANMTLEDFKRFVLNKLISIQKAVEDKDYDALKTLETEHLYVEHEKVLQALKTDKQCAAQQKILDMRVLAFITGAQDSITVEIDVEQIEYLYDQIAMQITSGSDQRLVKRAYRMTFMHKKTVNDHMYDVCPNCGAPLELDKNGKCVYCHSFLQKNYTLSWLVDEYRTI